MNMTAFSTQHPAIFEVGYHVCGGLQETRLVGAGQVWALEVHERKSGTLCLDGHRKRGVLLGKRDQVARRLFLDQVCICRKRL